MSQDTKNIEAYLKRISLPDPVQPAFQQSLRQRIVSLRRETRRSAARPRVGKLVFVTAFLLAAGAMAAVGIAYRSYYMVGPMGGEGEDDAKYYAFSPNRKGGDVEEISAIDKEIVEKRGVAGTQKWLEEVDKLRQAKQGSVIKVIYETINGNKTAPILTIEYTLPDGEKAQFNEGDRELDPFFPVRPEEMDEFYSLLAKGKGVLTGFCEYANDGKEAVVRYWEATLANGKRVSGEKRDPGFENVISEKQEKELMRLDTLYKYTSGGSERRQIDSQRFDCETSLFKLEDGGEVAKTVCDNFSTKILLTMDNLKEYRPMEESADAGVLLNTYQKHVYGRLFSFTTKKYLLSDGTEVVKSEGVPVE